MPQAISFGKQMVEGGSSFHERASSDIKHYSRDEHILKISTIPKAWHDKSWHTVKRTKRLRVRPAAHGAAADTELGMGKSRQEAWIVTHNKNALGGCLHCPPIFPCSF